MGRFLYYLLNPSKSWIADARNEARFFVAVFLFIIAILLQYELYSPIAPYPLYYIKTATYLILSVLYLIGTTLPLMLMTLMQVEDFPLAPGGKIKKSVSFGILFIISYGVAVIIVRGIQLAFGIKYGSYLYNILNLMEPVYFLYLFCRSSTIVFNLKFKKSLLTVVPFIFAFLVFPFEITIVTSPVRSGARNFIHKITTLDIIILTFLALAPLALFIVIQFIRKPAKSVGLAEKFKEEMEPSELPPEEAYRQAMMALNAGRQKRALELLDIAVASGKAKGDAILQRGKLYLELGMPEKAAGDLENYIDLKEKSLSAESYLFLIDAYMELKEWDNVLEVADETLERFPTHLKAQYFKAEAFKMLNRVEDAMRILKEMPEKWKEVPKYRRNEEKKWMDMARRLFKKIDEENN